MPNQGEHMNICLNEREDEVSILTLIGRHNLDSSWGIVPAGDP